MQGSYQYLQNQWQKLGYHNSQSERLFNIIIKAYSEPHRYYHTLDHLVFIFKVLTSRHESLDASVQWSIWFHDIVYQPGQTDNETKSADIAVTWLNTLAVDQETIHTVRQFILATQSHQSENEQCNLFLDADMAILGASHSSYAAYVSKIRQEFQSIPQWLYNNGRRQFIESLLDQPAIFLTDAFYQEYEATARRNLSWEINNMSEVRKV